MENPKVKDFALLQYFLRRRKVTDLFDAVLMLADAFCDMRIPSWRRMMMYKNKITKLYGLPMFLRHFALKLVVDCDALKFNYGNYSRVMSKNIVMCVLDPLHEGNYKYISVENLLREFDKFVSR